jgi:hypothetical protein
MQTQNEFDVSGMKMDEFEWNEWMEQLREMQWNGLN